MISVNIGNIERIIRISAGVAVLSMLFLIDGPTRWWGLVGFIPLASGLLGWCPPNSLLHGDKADDKTVRA